MFLNFCTGEAFSPVIQHGQLADKRSCHLSNFRPPPGSRNNEAILSALKQFNSVYDSLKPYQQRSMIKLVIHKVVVGDDNIHIALYGKLSGNALENVLTNDDVRSERINWLLE
ncbi:MAG: hypothetical protein PHD91_00215 [bacterium]|jgi:hypothetical protein|nr:hypothetical protein [bacterium]